MTSARRNLLKVLATLGVGAGSALVSARLTDLVRRVVGRNGGLLDEDEKRLRALVWSSSDVIAVVRADGVVDYVSPSIEGMTGFRQEERLGKSAFDLIHPDDVGRVRDAFAVLAELPGAVATAEFRMIHADGAARHVEAVAVNRIGEPGVGGIIVNYRDVGERRRAEERYKTLVEQIPAVTYVDELDHVSTSTYISPQIETILGFTAQERIATPGLWVEHLHPEDRDLVLAENDRTNRTGDPFDMEYRMIARDGRTVWIHDASVVLRDTGGRPSLRQGVMFDITDRKEAEERLERTEEVYRLLVEKVPAVVYVDDVDEENSAIYRSPHVEQVLGYAPEDFLSDPGTWQRMLHPEDRERVLEENRRTNETGEPFKMEYRMICKDGHVAWLRDEAVLIRDTDGRPLYWQGVFMDITERKEAENRVRFQAQLLEQVQAGIIATDVGGRVIHWNRHAERMYGFSREEALGRTRVELIVGPAQAEEAEKILGRLSKGESWEGEFVLRRKDGSTLPAHVSDSAVRDAEGRIIGFVGVSTDVTERKRAERERRLRDRAIEASNNGIIITDPNLPDDPMVYVNPAFEEMSGYTAEELKGRNCRMLQNSDRDQPELAGLRAALSERREFRGVLRNYRKDGALFYNELHIAPVFDEDGRLANFVGIMSDVTEGKRLEQEMKETNRHLAELASLRADFAAMVAHEIGAPLATIRGFTEMLETGELGPDEQADVLAKVGAEVEGLATLVSDVRSAAAVERDDFSLSPRPVPVRELLEDAARFAQTLPGDHPLILEDGVADENVYADPYRIGQVLRNLLSNAAKYSPGGTPIRVRTGREGGRVRVEVVDRGHGVHPDDAERVFEKFGRGRDGHGHRAYGVGLGLYLSRRIVRAHGGELSYRPEPGGGSSFALDLEVNG